LDQVDDARWRVQVNILPSRSAKQNAGVWDFAAIPPARAELQLPTAADVRDLGRPTAFNEQDWAVSSLPTFVRLDIEGGLQQMA
jgi:hypothetical protein